MHRVLVLAAMFAAAAAGLGGRPAPVDAQPSNASRPPAFVVDASWPTLPAGKVLGEVSSVAVDSRDRIWVLHRPRTVPAERRADAAPPVLEFDTRGRLIASWGGPGAGYQWPEREHGIYVDPRGFVWIGGNNGYGTPPPPGQSDDMLLEFTSAGKFVLQIGQSGTSRGNEDTANVHQAADAFLFPPTNELFVADGYGNQRVIVFDAASGQFRRMWGAFGHRPEAPPAGGPAPAVGPDSPQFGLVHSIKISKDGLVYVADRSNKRVQVFTTAGEYRMQAAIGEKTSAMQTAAGLAFSPDAQQRYLYVADLGNAEVDVIDRRTLAPLGSFGKRGAAPGEFDTLHHIAADSRGNIYTAEIGRNRRAQKFVVKR
jgi:DNA-binding beta-propeller fold protein YncE